MTITVKTMDQAYAWIERMQDKYDSYKITNCTNGIEVKVFNKG